MLSYARIENGVVVNIISVDSITAQAHDELICIEDYPVGIGDTYIDGVFYRNDIKVPSYADIAIDKAQLLLLIEMDEAYQEGVNSV